MRYIIISDIHGNLEALKTVLESEDSADELMVLGDIIGYGPYPEECMDLVREKTNFIIAGNHEELFRKPDLIRRFSPLARESFFMTRELISEETRKFIGRLTYTFKIDDILLAHSSPYHPEEFNYLRERDVGTAAPALNFIIMRRKRARVCFIGHSHTPGIMEELDGHVTWHQPENGVPFRLKKNALYIINPGSLGQPRNGIPDAQHALYDQEKDEVTLKTATYDVMKTVEALKEKGVSQMMWERLKNGM